MAQSIAHEPKTCLKEGNFLGPVLGPTGGPPRRIIMRRKIFMRRRVIMRRRDSPSSSLIEFIPRSKHLDLKIRLSQLRLVTTFIIFKYSAICYKPL
jgi:hypothetical protein